ncbi:Na+/proline symporter [Dethiosulfatibacter aminovorans DSM 17477]|uniref:Na+/proline symporter n=1 Tax=Dethiosulfatibacter aminovorans DSM 17477 TaxID=1121476 RepID=A0A1M6GTX6_9FIRM|nr:sodium:solute symporter family protein [Dethiosulfatibacter aminovorans]SHJ13414.1 Na+/proline symporter [Dethiosulfatibacter aminovorans DSM 17477]
MDGYRVAALILIVSYMILCLGVGFVKKSVITNRQDYFLAGKKTALIVLFFTTFASSSGAGNFIGQAGRGSLMGVSAYWWFLGEAFLAWIIFGMIIAPYLAKFKYMTMPQYIAEELCGGDMVVRKVAGFAALMPNIVWAGGQIMGLSYVLDQLFGIDYRIAVLVTSVVFIYYTVQGGLEAVIYTDTYQGIIQIALAVFVIFFGLKTFGFNPSILKERVVDMDPTHWDLGALGFKATISSFFVAFFGGLANPILWNRAFAAKDVRAAKGAFRLSMISTIVLVFFIISIGMSASTMNPGVGDQALVWLIINKMPKFLTVLLGLGVAGATMSTADTHLNAGAANIVVDIIDPEEKLSEEQAIKYSRYATFFAGIIAVGGAMTFPTIYDLAAVGYAICGGVLIPLFVMGYIMKDKTAKTFKSKLSIKAARFGIIVGGVSACLFELVPALNAVAAGGIIPAIVFTIGTTLLVNLAVKDDEDISSQAAR